MLGEVGELKSGGTPSKTKPEYWGGDYPWVTAKDLKVPVITNTINRLSETGFKSANIAPENSLLILVRGMTLFKDVPVCLAGRDVAFNQDIKALVIKKDVLPKYLLFYLRSQKNKLLDLVDSAGHGTGRLNTGLLKSFPVVVPTLAEQTAIADLLSTWDEAIEKTERLIAAKEKQFGSLIFSLIHKHHEDWQYKNLSIISEIKKGEQLNRTELEKNGDYPAWNGGITPSGYTDKWNTPENTITISEGGNSCGFVNYSDRKFWCGGHCYALIKLSEDISAEYLYFYLKAHEKRIMRLRVGSGLPNIQRKDLSKFSVHYPDKSSQKRIADTLDLAGKEIKLLKKQAEYFRAQKRGLMQRLLTGMWRININREVDKI